MQKLSLWAFEGLYYLLPCSLHLMGKVSHFNKAEKLELMRRRTVLLLYFLRSPFYDSYAK